MLKCVTYIADNFISSYLDKLLKETDLPENTRDKVIVLNKMGENGGATPDNMTGNRTCSWRHKSRHGTI